LATTVALLGRVAVFGLLMIGARAVAVGHEVARRAVADLAASSRQRIDLALRWAACVSSSITAAVALGLATAALAGSSEPSACV
jgi:hypothetical protein